MRKLVGILFQPRWALFLLLLATLLKGLAWSMIIPPWHSADEQQHFLYGQSIERFRSLRIVPPLQVPLEAEKLFELIQFGAVRYAHQPLDLTDRAGIAEQINLLDDPAIKRTYVSDEKHQLIRVNRFTTFHPPFYYVLVAAVQKPLEGTSILVRLLASRWLSVVLGLVIVILAYRVGRELWPTCPAWALLLATLASFQPMITVATATVGNQTLEIALFSGCLWISLRIIRWGLNVRRALTLGILVALGLLTKISFLSILPLLGLLVGWDVIRLKRERWLGWRTLWLWLLVFLLLLVISGWWYKDAILSGGGTLLAPDATMTVRPTVRLLPFLLHYGWLTIYQPVLHMYWGIFGWVDTPLPDSLQVILTWITVIVVWTVGWALVRQAVSRTKPDRTRQVFDLFFLGCATLGYIAFFTYLDFRLARDLGGGGFGIQGRYFLPPIIGQMAWLLVGMTQPVPPRLRRAWAWLVGVGMIALNMYAAFGVIAPRYYGPSSLPVLLEQATVLQPVSVTALMAICAAYVALSVTLIIALGGALVQERQNAF
jgi:Predicted membrane protein (DUF2142)